MRKLEKIFNDFKKIVKSVGKIEIPLRCIPFLGTKQRNYKEFEQEAAKCLNMREAAARSTKLKINWNSRKFFAEDKSSESESESASSSLQSNQLSTEMTESENVNNVSTKELDGACEAHVLTGATSSEKDPEEQVETDEIAQLENNDNNESSQDGASVDIEKNFNSILSSFAASPERNTKGVTEILRGDPCPYNGIDEYFNVMRTQMPKTFFFATYFFNEIMLACKRVRKTCGYAYDKALKNPWKYDILECSEKLNTSKTYGVPVKFITV